MKILPDMYIFRQEHLCKIVNSSTYRLLIRMLDVEYICTFVATV